MLKFAVTIMVLAALLASPTQAQVPGAYPHLQLTDGVTTLVPPSSGPFDNTHVFQAFSGSSFEARISYASAGQPNNNVLWALLVSATETPFSKTVVPPPLLTMPPVILLLPTPPNLNVLGQAIMTLFVPAGILDSQTYVQGLIYDSTASPQLKLSNGLKVDVDVPSFNVSFAWVKSTPATLDETLVRDFGEIEVGDDLLPLLKPIGLLPPPQAIADPPFYADDVRFLPVVPNAPDEPINPLARPFTRTAAEATTTDTTIIVQDTQFFPPRGRLTINVSTLGGSQNLWGNKQSGGNVIPRTEVIAYDGKLKDRFLNCKRSQLGSSAGSPQSATFTHAANEHVLGDYTFATTPGARARTRIGLDADNEDMPHVVIPAFTAPAGPEGNDATLDLDLYLFETKVDKVQGFVVFDRRTNGWRVLEGTLKNSAEGRWNPMVCLAPDGRSFIAELIVSGGALGWDHSANQIFAIRTDDLHWPASASESWTIPYDLEPDPVGTATDVRSRRVIMRATAIVGPDPDNYVAFIGLAHKWKYNTVTPGSFFQKNKGWEGEWVREEILVRDMIDLPMVPPGSSKPAPPMPRHYITTQFGLTGFGNGIIRFDPEVLASPDHTRLMVTAGGGNNADDNEDVYVIRNVGITAAGESTKVVGNVTGFSNNPQSASADPTPIRPFYPGGHGDGRRAAFSPGGTRVAFVALKALNGNQDHLCWANANASSYGKVKYVYDDAPLTSETFIMNGAYVNDRVIQGLRWVDENRLLFFMGKHPYDLVAAVLPDGNAPKFDLFLYDIPASLMTNLTLTSGVTDGFATLGRISPAGYMLSPNGDFAYFLRAGGISTVGGGTLPVDTPVLNLVGVNLATLDIFPVTGTEFGQEALIANLDLPATELLPQVEGVPPMRVTEGTGVQEGLVWFTSHLQGGNGSDELFAVNLDLPFVAFQATSTTKSGLHMSNIVADPYSGKVAFARTDGTDPVAPTQHPYVVDLDNFLFERDLLPGWFFGGANLGRVMDGSFHFIAPSGSAGDALVFSFGYQAQPTGIAQVATPAYYPLAAVSDLLAEPIPVVIPLIDTLLLGTDYRFYVPHAGLAEP